MAKQLCQANEVIAAVSEILMSHRVPQKVRVDFEAAYGGIFFAQRPYTTLGQWSSFTNEDVLVTNWRSSFKVRL